MKSAFLLLLIITATPLAFGQIPSPSESTSVCNLTFAQLPAIRGLKLGMSLNEVMALFPGVSDDDVVRGRLNNAKRPLPPSFTPGSDGYGLVSIQVSLSSYPNPNFTGIYNVQLQFFDEKLISLYLSYSATIWNNADELVGKLVEAYKLPGIVAWSSNNTNQRGLQCKDFSLGISASVGSIGDSSLQLTLLKSGWDDIRRQQQERRAAAIAKAQRDFKP